jgi:hypothetical protein
MANAAASNASAVLACGRICVVSLFSLNKPILFGRKLGGHYSKRGRWKIIGWWPGRQNGKSWPVIRWLLPAVPPAFWRKVKMEISH